MQNVMFRETRLRWIHRSRYYVPLMKPGCAGIHRSMVELASFPGRVLNGNEAMVEYGTWYVTQSCLV